MSDVVKLKPSNKSAIHGALESYNLTQDPYKQTATVVANPGAAILFYSFLFSAILFYSLLFFYILFSFIFFYAILFISVSEIMNCL